MAPRSTTGKHPVTGTTAPLPKGAPRRIGPYRLTGVLGSGGMGTVYLAVGDEGSRLAVKTAHPRLAKDSLFRARFAREVDLVRRVEGLCTARVLDADTEGPLPWMATEYVPGPTLSGYVREHGPLRGDMLVGLAAGLAEALTSVHRAGVLHRDLKPANLILAPEGPKVLDFGIARAIGETALTATGSAMGTPGWAAPEAYRGEEPTTGSDMFAWGLLVAYAATGRNPFGGGTLDALAFQVMEGEPDVAGVPEALAPVVRRALAKDRSERPTAEEALDEVLGAEQRADRTLVQVDQTRVLTRVLDRGWKPPAPVPLPRRRPSNRSLLTWSAAAAALLLLLGGGGFLLLQEGPFGASQASGGDTAEGPEGVVAEADSADLPGSDTEESVAGSAAGAPSQLLRANEYAQPSTYVQGDDLVITLNPEVEPTRALRFQSAESVDGAVVFDVLFQPLFSLARRTSVSEGDITVHSSSGSFPASSMETGQLFPEMHVPEVMRVVVPGAPESGRVSVLDFPTDTEVSLCYEVGQPFSADLTECAEDGFQPPEDPGYHDDSRPVPGMGDLWFSVPSGKDTVVHYNEGWPELSVRFDEVTDTGTGIAVTFTAEYLRSVGEFVIDTGTLAATDDELSGLDHPAELTELARLTPEESTQQLTVEFPGIGPRGAMRFMAPSLVPGDYRFDDVVLCYQAGTGITTDVVEGFPGEGANNTGGYLIGGSTC